MPTTPTTQFGNIPLGTTMATAAETAAIASEAAQAAVASITTDLEKLVSTAYKVKGTKTNYSDLPAWNAASPNTPENGDVWNVTNANGNIPAGTNYVFVEELTNGTRTGGSWDALGGTIDLSAYVKGVTIGSETQPRTPDQNGNVAIPLVGDGLNTSNDGLMSASDKYKLTNIASGAQVNVIEGVKLAGASSALTPSSKVVTIPNAVATGASGATNGLMTAADKEKLNGVATGAQVNVIESIATWDLQTLTPSSKTVTLPKGDGKGSGLVYLSDATNGTGVDENSGTAATPKAVADALAAAKSYADGITPDLSSRIKKATVKGKIDSPPGTLANLPSNAANLTLNQILNALYAGASESES